MFGRMFCHILINKLNKMHLNNRPYLNFTNNLFLSPPPPFQPSITLSPLTPSFILLIEELNRKENVATFPLVSSNYLFKLVMKHLFCL